MCRLLHENIDYAKLDLQSIDYLCFIDVSVILIFYLIKI